tara:strand:+ start:392 stop:658 length:267 start_codon:yes stop_codon:yes gene_type:complete
MLYIITLQNQPSGIYSVFSDNGNRIIPLFEQKDDAMRYLFQLEEVDDTPDLEIVEADNEIIIAACRTQGQKFSIITPDDFIVPPPERA